MNKVEEVLQEYAHGKISTERLAELLDVNYYVLHRALRQGCQLFEPKPSEGRLLTDEEIRAIMLRYCSPETTFAPVESHDRDIAQAQLAKDLQAEQARVERILGEIETHFVVQPVGTFEPIVTWQDIKKREGIK